LAPSFHSNDSPRLRSGSESLRITRLDPETAIRFTFDGETVLAAPGETVAVALMATGRNFLRTTSRTSEPRGLFCNMGVCFECLIEVDGRANQRACQTVVLEGMRVRTQHGLGMLRNDPEGWR